MTDIRFGVSYVEDLKKTIAKQKAELERLREELKGRNELYEEAKRQLFDKDGFKIQLAKAYAENERLREENEELKAEIAGPQAWADYIIARDARRAALEEDTGKYNTTTWDKGDPFP